MTLEERLAQVAVIGAAGKMGRGISLVLARSLARLEDRECRLDLIDTREEGLEELRHYLEVQSAKGGGDLLAVVRTGTDLHQAREARLVFEAVPEVEGVKLEVLRQLGKIGPLDTFFLSNTSAVPIGFLDREAGLGGRLIGFHFYNPPALQELVEVIPASFTCPELVELASRLGQRLGKTLVRSRDVAGFIGNGHFSREGLYALCQVERLADCFALPEALYAVNRATQEGLVRPMGVFQVIDYVGLDIFASILRVMARHLPGEDFRAGLIDRLAARGALGGQRPDGSQKDGFFRYQGRRPVAVLAPEQGEYLPLAALERVDRALGSLAGSTWKELQDDPERGRKLGEHFACLRQAGTLGARLALEYLRASRRIGQRLVAEGVAASPGDVDAVLVKGFNHLYGPFAGYGEGESG